MSQLNISLFGSPHIEIDGKPIYLKTHKAIGLIAYLSVTAKRQDRESLYSLLWPQSDPGLASAALRTTLWRINKSGLSDWILIDRDSIAINSSESLFVDVWHFHDQLARSQNHGHSPNITCNKCISILEDVVGTYRTGFMQSYFINDSRDYEEWQFFQQERMRYELSAAISRLVNAYRSKGDINNALLYAHHWLLIDPYHDEANRLLMQLYIHAGQRESALRQYNAYVDILKHDLNIMPDESIKAIYHQIKNGEHQEKSFFRKPNTGIIFYTHFPSKINQKGDPENEKLHRYIANLSKLIHQFGGKIFNLQSNSVSALFIEGDPVKCALAIHREHVGEHNQLSSDRSPGIIIIDTDDNNIIDMLNCADYTRVVRIGQSAWEGQILITPLVLALFDLPEEAQIIDFGLQTIKDLNEPIHLIELTLARY